MERKNELLLKKKEREEIILYSWKILENLEFQISLSTNSEKIKALKKHQKVTKKMITHLVNNNQLTNK